MAVLVGDEAVSVTEHSTTEGEGTVQQSTATSTTEQRAASDKQSTAQRSSASLTQQSTASDTFEQSTPKGTTASSELSTASDTFEQNTAVEPTSFKAAAGADNPDVDKVATAAIPHSDFMQVIMPTVLSRLRVTVTSAALFCSTTPRLRLGMEHRQCLLYCVCEPIQDLVYVEISWLKPIYDVANQDLATHPTLTCRMAAQK